MLPDQLSITCPPDPLIGTVNPGGSKSISNRLLIMKYISGDSIRLENLSGSNDTKILESLLSSNEETMDCQSAGTTFRFLTAYLAIKNEYHVLTGDERMKQRPIGPLVSALNELGADIRYLGNEGYPPIAIFPSDKKWKEKVTIQAKTSSQFISALLLIAPYLENGLSLQMEGLVVSDSYIEMTLKLMQQAGILLTRIANRIHVQAGAYQILENRVESDWSSASYFYGMAALRPGSKILIRGLRHNSIQGDSIIEKWMDNLGVDTLYTAEGALVCSANTNHKPELEFDFISSPDLFQTVSVTLAALGIKAIYSGLNTLALKETDRLSAIKTELLKTGVSINQIFQETTYNTTRNFYLQEGIANIDKTNFATWKDHRMAMSLSLLSSLGPIIIQNPEIVNKSYPNFWKDLISLGFEVE